MRVTSRWLILLMALSLASAYGSTTLNISTGFDASGNLLTSSGSGCDAHWVLVAGSGTTAACDNNAAQAVFPGDADSNFPGPPVFGTWLANGTDNSGSLWITSDASTAFNGGTPYPTYEVRFYLTDTTGASLTGSWTADDAGAITLNTTSLATSSDGQWTSLLTLPVVLNSDFVVGWNTLSIGLTYSDDYLEGVRFQGSVTGDVSFTGPSGPTPEPASALFVLAGLGGMAVWRRRAHRI